MFRHAFQLVSAASALLFCAAPALAQEPPAGTRAPGLCRASLDAGACNPGHAPNLALHGGRIDRAIMFFGGSGVQLVPPAPNASTASAPVHFSTSPALPDFARPLLTF